MEKRQPEAFLVDKVVSRRKGISRPAAAHLLDHSLPVKVYEAGAAVGDNVLDWGHAVSSLRGRDGCEIPRTLRLADHLEPLAEIGEFSDTIQTSALMTAISRRRMDKVVSSDREAGPFTLQLESVDGVRRDYARASGQTLPASQPSTQMALDRAADVPAQPLDRDN